MCYFGFRLSLKVTVPILAKCSFSLAIHLLISDIGVDLTCRPEVSRFWPRQLFTFVEPVVDL